MSAANKQKIYTSLDCILDTRIGTIARINEESALTILNNNYHERDQDIFSEIDMEMYSDLYNKRDIETLKVSTLTGCLKLVKHLFAQMEDNLITNPTHSGVELVVNVFPYVIEPELINIFNLAIKNWIGIHIPITFVNLSDKELIPTFFKDNFVFVLMYDYTNWINIHVADMQKNNLRDVVLFVPALYFEQKPSEKEMQELLLEAPHPFVSLEIYLKPAIDINLIDIKHFSIIRPNDKLEQAIKPNLQTA